ncbi:MAG: aminotransferase class III-fold pyridoxal phosphate-dependent enzyme, partial [Verrucomicrobiae bacterium]|nr:aminotransferase class III-fold pyridoxal phosphate-dependent enzyme [Verrucomicrobiae bacterium]
MEKFSGHADPSLHLPGSRPSFTGMGHAFQFVPVQLDEPIQTANRVINTPIPHPEDREIVETLRRCEPRSMSGQPLIVWDRAEGVHIHDRHGNQWLDFSSGVLVTNAGHARPEAVAALTEVIQRPLHHSYCFPNAERAALVEYLLDYCAPTYFDKVFLLTTGSEAIECAIKIARAYGHQQAGPEKDVIVTFSGDFHGRTLGAQMAGGIPALKDWIVNHDPCMVNAP